MRVVASAEATSAPRDLEDWFPGRWDPKRSIDRDLRVAVHAAAVAVRDAGWWTPGSGAVVEGGLVVGVDTHGVAPGLTFGRALQGASAGSTLRPSPFIHSLPSTPATTLGLLLGLQRYQTTVATGGLAGLDALAHGLDLLALGRCERVLVVALSVGADPPWRLGAALALTRGEGLPRVQVVREQNHTSVRHLDDVPVGYRDVAASGLLKVVRALSSGAAEGRVVHHDPVWGGVATVTIEWA